MRSIKLSVCCGTAAVMASLAGLAQAQLLEEEPSVDILSASAVPKPKLTMAADVYDMGPVLQLDRPEFDFNFTNTGNSLLVISRVQSTCGCTVPELTKKEFKPGEAGTIHVKYDPSGKHGAQVKQIHVYSNDPERPELPLTLKADVAPVVSVEPRTVNLSQVPKGESRKAIVSIQGRTADFAATYVSLTRGEHFSAKILETKQVVVGGKTLRQTDIEVTLAAGAPVSRLSDSLSIRTTDPREAVVFCPINADIVGDVKVEPGVLPFGVVKPGDAFKGKVTVASRSNTPFKILKAEVKQPNTMDLKLTFEPVDANRPTAYTVSAEGAMPALAPNIRPSPSQGYLVITTDIEREDRIEIPFYVQPRLTPPTAAAGAPAQGTVPPAPRAPGQK